MSFESKANTDYAEDILPVIFLSSDSIEVRGFYFARKADNLFRSSSGNYLYLKDNSSFIIRYKDLSSWASFYVDDKNKADQLIGDNYKPQNELETLNDLIRQFEEGKDNKIISAYIFNLRSRKNQPQLESEIIGYWKAHWQNTAISTVIVADQDFIIVRNALGVVLRKTIKAWVVVQQNDQCYMEWGTYGYESLGAGVFSKELKVWGPQTEYTDSTITASTNEGSTHLHAGDKFPVDCSILK
jgi:hypothetical protein